MVIWWNESQSLVYRITCVSWHFQLLDLCVRYNTISVFSIHANEWTQANVCIWNTNIFAFAFFSKVHVTINMIFYQCLNRSLLVWKAAVSVSTESSNIDSRGEIISRYAEWWKKFPWLIVILKFQLFNHFLPCIRDKWSKNIISSVCI